MKGSVFNYNVSESGPRQRGHWKVTWYTYWREPEPSVLFVRINYSDRQPNKRPFLHILRGTEYYQLYSDDRNFYQTT